VKKYVIEKSRRGRTTKIERTLPELIEYFRYTLEVGKSYNRKINLAPKTALSLVSNLNKAKKASAANGVPDTYFYLL
jgi:hypothetical protein